MTRDLGDVDFAELAKQVGDRLLHVHAPLQACVSDPGSPAAEAALANLRNPYAIQDAPGAFLTTGWLGAYENRHSPRAVAAESAADIVAAVEFARDREIRLVIKGAGHDYLGRSSAPGSVLVWTHRMREITVHDAFRPTGTDQPAVPAITLGAGTRWLEAYQALAGHGRYVQGGGCVSVGAAGGFTQGGGFGSFSRRYGTAAGNVLEAEVVTASGDIVVANAAQHADLFWAVRGGGGGTFGVVTRLTMRTYPMPDTCSAVTGTIRASGDAEFRRLIQALAGFLPSLCNDRWGESVLLSGDNSAEFFMLAVDLGDEEARAAWRPFLDWVQRQPSAFTSTVSIGTVPFGITWDARWRDREAPDSICHDDRPGAPRERFWFAMDQHEVSCYLHSFGSWWLRRRLFDDTPGALADALFEASRHWPFRLELNKALSGAAPDAVARDRGTAINPAVFDAAVLALAASWQQYAFPGVPGHEPDAELGAVCARRVGQAMGVLRALAPGAGSYVNQADYFEPDWQQNCWGDNYPRLLQVKRRYDPANIFRVHHGVGSEIPGWPAPQANLTRLPDGCGTWVVWRFLLSRRRDSRKGVMTVTDTYFVIPS
jgi:FAD/FMN-containing dehydrogenase